MPSDGPILFTAFEPSGDALAAPLIRRLRESVPDRAIYALGGPKMRDAGAELLESTTDHAVMLTDALGQIQAHRARMARLRKWMEDQRLSAVVPTDSPAANWSVCKLTRQLHPDAKIVHLVAPQLWAWAPWRIRKLRRLTDHLLCLLPFEPDWFARRGVPGTFVGHPLFETAPKIEAPAGESWPDAEPRLALLPGSRAKEVAGNYPDMLACVAELRKAHPGLAVVVAASDEARAAQIESLTGDGDRDRLEITTAGADAVLDWADTAIVVSGTATLQTARHRVPMVTVYRVTRRMWHGLGRWLVQSPSFTLPNLILGALDREPSVPELIPYFGPPDRLVQAIKPLLSAEGPARRRQVEDFQAIAERFRGTPYVETASERIEAVLRGEA